MMGLTEVMMEGWENYSQDQPKFPSDKRQLALLTDAFNAGGCWLFLILTQDLSDPTIHPEKRRMIEKAQAEFLKFMAKVKVPDGKSQ